MVQRYRTHLPGQETLETWVRPLGQEEALEGAPSSILAWRILWTEAPGGVCPRGRRVRHDRAT